jgi:glycosyltransferase involved in cell wall biosynthesis
MDDRRSFSVSVVIPLYNKGSAVGHTLKSVLGQTRPPNEIIIVDDGSTDHSASVVEELLRSHQGEPPVRVITQENHGVSAARNRGAAEAQFDYIAFLDADDEWLPECLAEAERLANSFPAATVLTVRYAKMDPNGSVTPEFCAVPPDFFGEVRNPLETYRKGYGLISSSSVIVRADVWRRSGGFPVGIGHGEDICWWVKLFMSETIAHSARPLIIWHQEHSGAAARNGQVPYHFSYFLGTSEGRTYLKNRALVEYLGSNLAVQIGGRRVAEDHAVVAELSRLSSALPLHLRLRSFAAAHAPIWLLLHGMKLRRMRSRRLFEGVAKKGDIARID